MFLAERRNQPSRRHRAADVVAATGSTRGRRGSRRTRFTSSISGTHANPPTRAYAAREISSP